MRKRQVLLPAERDSTTFEQKGQCQKLIANKGRWDLKDNNFFFGIQPHKNDRRIFAIIKDTPLFQ